jgi:hypothetical protein
MEVIFTLFLLELWRDFWRRERENSGGEGRILELSIVNDAVTTASYAVNMFNLITLVRLDLDSNHQSIDLKFTTLIQKSTVHPSIERNGKYSTEEEYHKSAVFYVSEYAIRS